MIYKIILSFTEFKAIHGHCSKRVVVLGSDKSVVVLSSDKRVVVLSSDLLT